MKTNPLISNPQFAISPPLVAPKNKNTMKIFQILVLTLLVQCTFAQKTLGPYLEIDAKNASLPLLASKAQIDIVGTIAHINIQQTYHNTGKEAIEAKYVFPMSTQAAVHNMTMTIGDRTIKARVFEKEKANEVYQEALASGKRASKLDQHRPNVFQMNVGNILPTDTLIIDIYYTEMLVPENGEYQLVYPGVVGPRYTGENTSGEAAFNTPYTPKGTPDKLDYEIKVNLEAGMIIQNTDCESHQIRVNYPNPKRAEIKLTADNQNASNRDFILNYSLRGKDIQTGLLLYEGEEENFFAYMVAPPEQVTLDKIPPREYFFIVDVSGSMRGFPLEVSKNLMQNLLCNLKETDVFNIMLFASSSQVFRPNSVPVSGENIESALQFLHSTRGGGGTNLLSALKKAYSMPRNDLMSAKSMVVITDGYISVEKEAFQFIEQNLNHANVFSFGIGKSVNRYLIEGISRVAHTTSFVATNQSQAQEVAKAFQNYIALPVLTQIQFEAQGFEVYDVEPKSIPDVFATRPILIYGKWKGNPNGTLSLTGYQGSGKFVNNYKVQKGTLSRKNEALKYLWARKKIENLDDYKNHFNTDTKQEVIDLALKYNLATAYTSFVAVDTEVVTDGKPPKTVKQPLPLPQNVENSAVGAEAAVSGKSKASYGYTLQFEGNSLTKTQERTIKIWLKVRQKKMIEKLFQKGEAVKLIFDKKGQLVSVEILEKGKWDRVANLGEYSFILPEKVCPKQEFSVVLKK